VLKADQARALLDSIKLDSLVGLRDRALIALMCFTFARVSAMVNMHTEDYYQNGKRWWIRLHEKGGKRHEVPAHHNAEAYLDAYLDAAGIRDEKKSPLFRSVDHWRKITANPMTRTDVLRMVKRRALAAGLPSSTCCHTFRATGITAYLENGGTIENAQALAAHESPRTTKLYDRTGLQNHPGRGGANRDLSERRYNRADSKDKKEKRWTWCSSAAGQTRLSGRLLPAGDILGYGFAEGEIRVHHVDLAFNHNALCYLGRNM
jgi:integrase